MPVRSPTSRPIWSAVVLLVVLAACLALYALKLAFTESLYSQRGSLAFFITVNEPVIRTFPVFDAVGKALYHSGCGDGPKLPDEAISYRSRLSPAELADRVRRHITSHGYVPSDANLFSGAAFVKGGQTLYLNVTAADGGGSELEAQVLFDAAP